MLRAAIILVGALAVGLAASSASAQDEERQRRTLYWLLQHDVIMAEDTRLGVESWLEEQGIRYAKDHTIKEITAAVDVTEAKGRPVVERLCEAYPDTQGWTVYVKHPDDGAFIFATTCPATG